MEGMGALRSRSSVLTFLAVSLYMGNFAYEKNVSMIFSFM